MDSTLPDDPARPEFWEERYAHGHSGWDIGQPAPPFVDLMNGPDAPPPGSMLVPGCGRGHDALYFARLGFDVTGVDFAHSAVEAAQESAREAGVQARFFQGDIFALPTSFDHSFDYVLEHTLFSAIPPDHRVNYMQLVLRVLGPGGLFIALFFSHGRPGGPPFNTTERQIRALFGRHFTIERLEPPARSVAQRAGQELFALMRPL